jgi:Flp pilus assembly pilin Flp
MQNLLIRVHLWLASLRDEQRGQDLVEYALFGGLIAIGIIAVGAAAYTGIVNSLVSGIQSCVDFTDGGCDPW